MNDLARRLRDLHFHDLPLVLPNVWDARTAQIFAEAGFPALATPSSGIAASLGYSDRQGAPYEEMFAVAARIAAAVDVPVTVDAEAGYGLPADEFAERLLATGAVGCNLEDTDHATSSLVPVKEQARRLADVRRAAPDLVINARVDVFLHKGTVAEAVERALAYLDAGADCVYPILAREERAIAELVERVPGPINEMFTARGPSLTRLAELGVARITFGGGLYEAVIGAVREMATRITAGSNPYGPENTRG
ncbi:isocitrate lyase/phosphoenolpyruvate mutase family protein [Spongiactinospora sp. TRM90649]|uniref:isocitrate lyase/PEP mutase family protein n=1 Tax=Spongiactinospora sp. TRM90649 TaxID=3031114 RepID=UPI0023F82048|nr:isocitrate lyase/phosphoenolpyruvate mutase family protein [Spongiactinospora sp. TRM90649]MDF5754421.1 isocitrate lyase/phosphoenolpyruvate mutase family protein [Spongiactinospora sp. TRM90649]